MANRTQRKGKPKAVPNNVTLENDVQFNLEVLWCIRQIEDTLATKKMNVKQAQDATYSLNVLRSKTAPVIKKRQVMKVALGDYRSKMLEESKKLEKAQEKVKLRAVSPSKKSHFVKKSSLNLERTGNAFQFNFDVPTSNAKSEDDAHKASSSKLRNSSTTDFKFLPSDNSFRFTFSQPPT